MGEYVAGFHCADEFADGGCVNEVWREVEVEISTEAVRMERTI